MPMRTTVLLAATVLVWTTHTASAQPPGRAPFRPPTHPIVAACDTDGDGELSAAEIENAAKAMKQLDKNEDGKLTRTEIGRGGGRPAGPGARPGPGRPGPNRSEGLVFESAPIPRDDAEKSILAVLDDLDKNQRAGMMNVPVEDGRLLRLLVEQAGAKHVVEIGTSNGYSGIWLCLALRTTGGKLTTYEIDARRASLARENFKRAGVEKLVTLIEGNAHEEVAKITEPIDLLFLDADKEGYVDYLKKLLPRVRPGGLIVAHNMNTRQADPGYVKAITSRKDLETLFLHMDRAGVAVSMKKR